MEAFSYSNPLRVNYGFGLLAFSADLTNFIQPPPRANAARVVDIHVRATVTFAGATTKGIVNVGTAATAAKYAALNIGVTAAGASANFTTAGGTPYNEALVIFSDINLARDAVTKVQLQCLAPTGGGAAGTGYVDVVLAWY